MYNYHNTQAPSQRKQLKAVMCSITYITMIGAASTIAKKGQKVDTEDDGDLLPSQDYFWPNPLQGL